MTRPFRFSLRALLLAVTAFAIGFPIWYRWPFKEEEILPSFNPPHELKRVTTWHRLAGGRKVQHGPETTVLGGLAFTTTTYKDGVKHGPYVYYNIGDDTKSTKPQLVMAKSPKVTGQYVDGSKDGVWVERFAGNTHTTNWIRGRRDGTSEIETRKGVKWSFRFSDGKLTHLNGQPAVNRLCELTAAGDVDAKSLAAANMFLASSFLTQRPLRDVVASIERKRAPITLDCWNIENADMPIGGDFVGIDFLSALTMLTVPNGLGCDYRYGCIWITSAEDAGYWRDPTGIADVQAPKNSALATVWNESADCLAMNQSLSSELDKLARRFAIAIDTSAIDSVIAGDGIVITCDIKGRMLCDVLGEMLYRSRCHCKLKGETLVILPPEK